MCTLMQKDVLIELVANAQAIVTKCVDVNSPLTDDEIKLGKIRDFLYSTSPEDISYTSLINEVRTIQQKFEPQSPHVVNDYDVDEDVVAQFPMVWRKVLSESAVSSQAQPYGILLGGQPGAGKSYGTMQIKKRLQNNVLIINGDEFRPYHSQYHQIYKKYGKDAPKYTADFAGKMVGKVRDKAIQERFNVLIEGTFRTIETPLKEINNFKEYGYQTEIIICTCPKNLSWESTVIRAKELELVGIQPRYVAKDHYDLVVTKLAENVEKVLKEAQVSHLEVYSREGKLFDSYTDSIMSLAECINKELNRK